MLLTKRRDFQNGTAPPKLNEPFMHPQKLVGERHGLVTGDCELAYADHVY
jgi:hypothetical protein